MLFRISILTLLAAFAISVTASAQTPTAAAPGAAPGRIEPTIAFGSSVTLGVPQHAVALRTNGDVVTWGANDSYCLLGRPTAEWNRADHTPTVVMHRVKEIAASGASHLALTVDGKVYGWGGGLPMGSDYYPCDGPAPVPSLVGKVVTHIGFTAGFTSRDDFAVAVTDSGDLYCWGNSYSCPANQSRNPDSSFRGGDADPVTTFTRLNLPELNGNVLDIRLGLYHTLVLTKDRKLYAFGRSRWGQLGDSRFTQGGAVFGFTPNPVLTNVVSFAAGTWHSVAAKDDGTVWTWGHNQEYSELCDGTTTNRRVPTQLPGISQVVQVAAASRSTFMRTKDGVIYGCGSNNNGQLGLEGVRVAPRPAQVQVPVAARSSLFTTNGASSAFSPDGCAVYIAGGSWGIRGATEPSSTRFTLRAGLSLCAPPSTTRLPDVDAGAFHRLPPAPIGVDCWIPKTEEVPRDAKVALTYAPIRQAMLTTERLVKENDAFIPLVPEGVRMKIFNSVGNGALRFVASAYPRQTGPGSSWTTTSCNVSNGDKELAIGSVQVYFNEGLGAPAQSFNAANVKPARYINSFPVYKVPGWGGASLETVVITRDGRIPVVPVTLADRLDREAEKLARRLADNAKQRTSQLEFKVDESVVRNTYETLRKTDPAGAERYLETMRQAVPSARQVAEQLAQEGREVQRQVEALRVYRASFSPDELRAAFVEGDRNGPEKRQLDARIRALEAPTPEDQAQANALGTRIRELQRQALTRGLDPKEAARLRGEANDLGHKANAFAFAQRKRVAPEVADLRYEFELKLIRPGDASKASEFKEDPTFWDKSDPGRIQIITVNFQADYSRETTLAQATAWMAKVMETFDYAALKALVR